ncbi:DUF3566 domain-containing protein [Arachnia propionica]|uniref:DUF3566 domain-containing protein n=1 Tax=Arachnia propionica TaxID=1750 RepID=A0A3P1WQF7_9ACTN|nr:DUF3566 domain-containing protein [Arachnia propionica]RRD48078.1 DUF3566 domain-containing protein [Arachnia propionica]
MSDKNPQWPGRDGKPGVSFAPKGSRKQRNQGRSSQKAAQAPQAAQPAKPTKPEPAAAAAAPVQSPPPPPPAPKQSQAAPSKDAGKQSAAKQGKPADPMWATPPAAPAPKLAPMPAPGGSSSQAAASGKEASKDVTSTGETSKGGIRKTRKARLRLSRVDPWSVMKTSFLFSIAFGIILVVVTAVLWRVVEGSGALDSVNSTMNQLIGDANTKFEIRTYINSGRIVGLAAVLAAVDVLILTAVSTLFAFLYNLAATVIGGLEVTLSED